MYPNYLPLYTQQYAVLSPLTLAISGTNTGNNYNITLTINKLASITGTDLRAHLVLTESNIAYSWQGQSEIDDTERLMVPDANGSPINFNSGNTVTLNLSFTKDPSWVTSNCQLIAFVQDHGTKTIYNGAKTNLNALYLPLPTDFAATPTSGCSPMTVNFTDQSVGATQWNWSFPGGTPATSTLQNPVVVYNTAGSYDVTLNAGNPSGNQYGSMSKAAYISVNSSPVAPTTPTGNNALCINPPDQTYSTTSVANTTGYTWELIPSTAGVITPSGTTCSINWDNTFTGIAQLKVRALNACGNSPWTPFLNITVSEQPGQAAVPAGPTALCMNAGTSTYNTSGASNAQSYLWDLVPAEAGALYPNGTSLNIIWTATFSGNASLKVKGVNGSCEGVWSDPLAITITPGPAAYNVTGGGVYCAIGGTGKPVDLSGSQSGTSYTLYLNNVATSTVVNGTGNAITFGNQTGAGTYTVMASASGNCTNTMTGNASILVDPQAPLAPGAPIGPAQVFSGATPTCEYTTVGGTYASSYTWEIIPSDAGTMTGSNTIGIATWNPAYTGSASIKVQGVNSCGGGSYSGEFVVTVDVGVGVAELSSEKMFRLYPNPARSSVSLITSKSTSANITIFNTLGAESLTWKDVILKDKYTLDISSLTTGIYFVRIQTPSHQQILKLQVE
jgi:PKD repeat protein